MLDIICNVKLSVSVSICVVKLSLFGIFCARFLCKINMYYKMFTVERWQWKKWKFYTSELYPVYSTILFEKVLPELMKVFNSYLQKCVKRKEPLLYIIYLHKAIFLQISIYTFAWNYILLWYINCYSCWCCWWTICTQVFYTERVFSFIYFL